MLHSRTLRCGAAVLAALVVSMTSGCSMSVPRIPGITPYRMDIQQGNYVSQDMVSQLRPGMTRDQVRLILGTPLLTDIFHANRWDYVYWHEDAKGNREERRIAVHFDGDKLARLDGDVTSVPAAPTPDLPPTQMPPRREEPK